MNWAKKFCLVSCWLSLLMGMGCPGPQPHNDVVLPRTTMTMALVADADKLGQDDAEFCDVVFDTVHGPLSQRFDIVDLKGLEAARLAEARATGQSSIEDPSAYERKKFNAVDVMAYFWVLTSSFREDDGSKLWYATIGTHGVRRQTGEELWRFQLKSGERRTNDRRAAQAVSANTIGDHEARLRAVKNLANAVAEDILDRIGNRKGDVSESTPESQVYVIKFIGFNNAQSDNIREAMADLETQKHLQVRPGGSSVGSEYLSYKVKWMHTADDQLKVIQTIQDACAGNEVKVECGDATPGILVFQRK